MRGRRSNRENNKKVEKFKSVKTILSILIIIAFVVFIFNIMSNTRTQEQHIAENKENTNIVEQEQNNDEKEEKKDSEEEEKAVDKTITMAVTGDIMCHDSMYKDAYDSSKKTYDFSYMFDDIKYYIQTADVAVGNLETTFAGEENGYSNYPAFNTPEQLAKNLKKIGFDVMTTANNHCMDKGYKGIVSTIDFLDDADLLHTGTYKTEEDSKKILIKDVKGVKIAFLSFTYGTNGIKIPNDKSFCVNLIDKDLILEQLQLAKKENPDVICVSMHWGVEYQTKPNSTQKELAEYLFQNGADIIIGNHPHVPQPMEKLEVELADGTKKQGFVIYSLGNFMADQNKQYTRDSAILNIQITKKVTGGISIDKATYTPIYYYKNENVSKQKYKILDINDAIQSYEANVDTSIGKNTYNTLVKELKNIKNIIGDEIK